MVQKGPLRVLCVLRQHRERRKEPVQLVVPGLDQKRRDPLAPIVIERYDHRVLPALPRTHIGNVGVVERTAVDLLRTLVADGIRKYAAVPIVLEEQHSRIERGVHVGVRIGDQSDRDRVRASLQVRHSPFVVNDHHFRWESHAVETQRRVEIGSIDRCAHLGDSVLEHLDSIHVDRAAVLILHRHLEP